MRLALDKFLEKLGVGHVLSPYETQPWFMYDELSATTCSAEVRMGPGGDDVEAEIQFLKEVAESTDTGTDEDGDGESDTGGSNTGSGGCEQILWLSAQPVVANEWTLKTLRIKNKDYLNEFHDWEGKGCDFFAACVQAIQMNELPDIDSLIEEHMKDDTGWGGGKRGKIGRKSPKIKPGQLMGMKK